MNSKDYVKNLARKIRVARREADLSQAQLAKLLNISDKTVSAYESGRALPPIPTLTKIAKITLKDIPYFVESRDPVADQLSQIQKQLQQVLRVLQSTHEKK